MLRSVCAVAVICACGSSRTGRYSAGRLPTSQKAVAAAGQGEAYGRCPISLMAVPDRPQRLRRRRIFRLHIIAFLHEMDNRSRAEQTRQTRQTRITEASGSGVTCRCGPAGKRRVCLRQPEFVADFLNNESCFSQQSSVRSPAGET